MCDSSQALYQSEYFLKCVLFSKERQRKIKYRVIIKYFDQIVFHIALKRLL